MQLALIMLLAGGDVTSANTNTAFDGHTASSLGEETGKLFWGQATNGLVASLSVNPSMDILGDQRIRVYIHEAFDTNAPPPTQILEPDGRVLFFGQSQAGDLPRQRGAWGLYFQATNVFCGPVVLRDREGATIPILHPEVNSTEAYPDTFTFSQLLKDEIRGRVVIASNVGGRSPRPLISRIPELASFNLSDYFALEKPGDYQLTVWPKVYKRVEPDSDVCERVDLPPITVNVYWQGPTFLPENPAANADGTNSSGATAQ